MEKKVTVLQGDEDFILKCLVDGNPKPQVKWRRKDTNLYWENPLRFHKVHYNVEGMYQCVAVSDGFTPKTKDVFIDVIGKLLVFEIPLTGPLTGDGRGGA